MILVVARATELDDAGLMAIGQCAQTNLAQEAANVGKRLAAISKLIGIINLFLGMLGRPRFPTWRGCSDSRLTARSPRSMRSSPL